MSTALALARSGGGFIVAPTNVNELWSLCKTFAESELVPKDYQGKPANCFVAIQMGAELGISPMQAMQNIAVMNGRGSIFGDLMLAICMGHPDYVDTVETWDPKTETATCVAKRKGRADKAWTFSMQDARNAVIWVKGAKSTLAEKDTYKAYPRRMCQFRARGFSLRDQWADVTKGVITREEAEDYPNEVRAEVVSTQPMTNQLADTSPSEVMPPKPESKPVGPVFSPGWPDKQWAGRLLTDAPSNVLCDYVAFMEELQKDESRKRLHDKAKLYVEQAAAVLDKRSAAADDIADKLQEIVDGVANPDTNVSTDTESEGWLSS